MGKNVLDIIKSLSQQGQYVAFLLTATVLTAITDVVFYTATDGDVVKSFLILGANYMMALATTLVLYLSSHVRLKAVLQLLFQIIISTYCALLMFCWALFGTPIDKGMIALITGTNPAETHEFFDVYVSSTTMVLFIITALLILSAFVVITQRVRQVSTGLIKGLCFYTLIGCCCLGFSFYTLPGRIEGIMRTEQKDLSQYLHHPNMVETEQQHPHVVMIIIGESFSRSHSSLYGYDKPTNPRLEALCDSGRLMVFKDPIAPATHTANAFKHFMTTYTHETTDQEWYECLTLVESLQASGYHTAWFSNQAATGWHDNISAAFAKLCHEHHYTTEAGGEELDAQPDGVLLPLVEQYLDTIPADSQQAVFIHLMGQHNDFEKRYPADFSHFHMEDYTDYPENQRYNRANYDNATLYNDYIIAHLFALLRQYDAVGIYFSDHGIDLYESSADYCSHANTSNAKSVEVSLKIPMIVFTSDTFQKNHPQAIDQLRQTADKTYNNQHLPDLVQTVTGYRCKQ